MEKKKENERKKKEKKNVKSGKINLKAYNSFHGWSYAPLPMSFYFSLVEMFLVYLPSGFDLEFLFM